MENTKYFWESTPKANNTHTQDTQKTSAYVFSFERHTRKGRSTYYSIAKLEQQSERRQMSQRHVQDIQDMQDNGQRVPDPESRVLGGIDTVTQHVNCMWHVACGYALPSEWPCLALAAGKRKSQKTGLELQLEAWNLCTVIKVTRILKFPLMKRYFQIFYDIFNNKTSKKQFHF